MLYEIFKIFIYLLWSKKLEKFALMFIYKNKIIFLFSYIKNEDSEMIKNL